MMRDRRYGGDSRGYRGEGRFRSPTPPRRMSPPSGRFRNRGAHSPPRRRYDGAVEEERRVGGSLRRDYDQRSDRGSRDYDHRSYNRGDKGSSREYDVNSNRGDRGNDRVYDRNFVHEDTGNDREHNRNFSRGDGGEKANDRGYGRKFFNGDRNNDGNSSRGGDRISSYGFVDRGRDYGDRERVRDDGLSRSTYQSGGSGEYWWRMNGANERTSSKFQWDHLLDESRNAFKSSIHDGVGGSGLRSDLNYNYRSNKFFDEGCDGLVVDGNPVLVAPERDYASSSYPMNVSFPTKSSSNVDAVGSALRYPSSGVQKGDDFHFHDKHHVEKLVTGGLVTSDPLATESYKDKFLRYSSTDTDYIMPPARLKGYDPVPRGSFKEDISSSLRDDLSLQASIRLSTGMMTNTSDFDGFGENSRTRSPVNHEGRFGDLKSYSRSYLGTAEENGRDYKYPQVDSEEGGKFPGFTETCRNSLAVGDEYSLQDTSRLGALDPIGDKADVSSHQGYLRGSRLLDHHSTSFGLPISNCDDAHQSFNPRRMDVEDQRYRDPQPNYERECYYGTGSSLLGEHNHDDEVAGTPRFHHGRSGILPSKEYDTLIGDIDGNSDEELMMGNVSLPDSTGHKLKRKPAEMQFGDGRNMNYDLRDAGELWSNNGDSLIPSKSLRVSYSRYGKSRRALDVVGNHQSPSSTVFFPSSSHLRKSHICGPRDIKKRLGPVSQKVHVSQRLVKKYTPSLKKRLGPGPKKNHVTLPWLKNLNAPSLPSVQDESGGSAHLQGENSPEDNVSPAKPEPPENSEDFKQLVKIAFFKFVKQLNETPAKRRKYKEQGSAASLKCIICRSSEEFVSTESLTAHALTCQMLGFRAQHLGFHKALCALMGWKCAEQSNGTWSCDKLPDVDNLALKEDLILWPPVVIIHNSTIGNKNPDQQVIVTIEELEAKLRDMGFGDKAKVYRGKPANQSVMVMEFGATLSGLLEAQRLHKIFADKNCGRAEFLEIKSSSNQNNGRETESASVNNVDSILYGYSGIAEDLDKLDFDAKKRRLVKSKKEIEDIAGAPIKRR